LLRETPGHGVAVWGAHEMLLCHPDMGTWTGDDAAGVWGRLVQSRPQTPAASSPGMLCSVQAQPAARLGGATAGDTPGMCPLHFSSLPPAQQVRPVAAACKIKPLLQPPPKKNDPSGVGLAALQMPPQPPRHTRGPPKAGCHCPDSHDHMAELPWGFFSCRFNALLWLLGRDCMVPGGHGRGLSALLPHPAALCALKLPSKELLSIRSRCPCRLKAKTPVCLRKHIDLVQSAMKGSTCPPEHGQWAHGGQAWLCQVQLGRRDAAPCCIPQQHPAVTPQPLARHRPALQDHRFKGKGIKALISLISLCSLFVPLLPRRSSSPRSCLCRSRNENPWEWQLSLGNSWQGSRQPR